jgi:transposase
LEFADVRGPRATRALAALVHELCKVTTVKAVALLFGLHRHTVKDIDKVALEKVQAGRDLDGITVLGVDEIAVGKGHKYWTLVSALEGPRGPELLHIVEGRSEKRLKRSGAGSDVSAQRASPTPLWICARPSPKASGRIAPA